MMQTDGIPVKLTQHKIRTHRVEIEQHKQPSHSTLAQLHRYHLAASWHKHLVVMRAMAARVWSKCDGWGKEARQNGREFGRMEKNFGEMLWNGQMRQNWHVQILRISSDGPNGRVKEKVPVHSLDSVLHTPTNSTTAVQYSRTFGRIAVARHENYLSKRPGKSHISTKWDQPTYRSRWSTNNDEFKVRFIHFFCRLVILFTSTQNSKAKLLCSPKV